MSANLELVILPCREPVPTNCYEKYNSAYSLWHKVWSQTLKELDGVEHLYSNEFTRHDFMSVIFQNAKAVSLMCYSIVDLNLISRREDSWFSCWDPNYLEQQKSNSPSLFAAWFCTDMEFRKSNKAHRINVSELIIQTFAMLVLEENYKAGYGVTRNNRSVDKYSQNAGSVTVGQSSAHGCDVNLVLFEPEKIKEAQQYYSAEFMAIWNKRKDFRKGENNERELRKTA